MHQQRAGGTALQHDARRNQPQRLGGDRDRQESARRGGRPGGRDRRGRGTHPHILPLGQRASPCLIWNKDPTCRVGAPSCSLGRYMPDGIFRSRRAPHPPSVEPLTPPP
ncbi:Hypothetical protein AA314_08530 [Archangium gephyra]|uniref:Uncharacterized protein n=1 Tax=Archangium gephyra TaxID=48 RepID=A0AAC8QGA5_9BACT|nr:Hypothetical protein AA314_08530 [Archangium gephyra]